MSRTSFNTASSSSDSIAESEADALTEPTQRTLLLGALATTQFPRLQCQDRRSVVGAEIDGTQYIAIQSGWGVDAQRSQGALATNNIGIESNVPQGGVIWVFAL